jgi:hypothetical protein
VTDTPHDALFQYTFSSVEHAAPALRAILPKDLAEQIDFSTLAPQPGHFIDAKLDSHRTDLLFSVKLAHRKALLYLLFEHQSYVDPWLLLRMLGYMVRIWRAYLDEHPKAKRLPVIVPVVLHHSKKGWRAARRFEDLLDMTPPVRQLLEDFIPRFGVVLDDISDADDAALYNRAMTALGRLVLYLFRHARTPLELFAGLGRWAEVLLEVTDAPNGGAAVSAVLEYLQTVTKRDESEVHMAMRAALKDDVFDRIVRAGERKFEKGLQEGLHQGLHQGQRDMLRRMLELRYGDLPPWATAHLDAAAPETFDAIAQRLLVPSSTLAEVLGTPAPAQAPAKKPRPPKRRSPAS